MERTVEVVPDVTGVDRSFHYSVPPELDGRLPPGSIVRVVLNNRRVRGWVVAEVPPRPGLELRPVRELVSLGPGEEVVSLARWASFMYAGRLRPLLVAASPPRNVRALPPPAEPAHAGEFTPAGHMEAEVAEATARALAGGTRVLRLPPAAPRLAVVRAALRALSGRPGDLLVLAASRGDAVTVARRLEDCGNPVALQPEGFAEAAAGGRTVVGTRSAVLATLPRLAGVVVLDAHADAYQEERVPTFEAHVLATERARRAGVPCLLVSPCPPVEMLAGSLPVTVSREAERAGWAPLVVVDARDEDPRAGGYPSELANLLRAAAGDGGRPVVAVLNRRGRARLLACPSCQDVLRCRRCGGALVQPESPPPGEPATLQCPRCAESGPALCGRCGPIRPRVLRPGAGRARDDLAALTGLEVAEVTAGDDPVQPRGAAVLVGTEAVLHRVGAASLVVFLDFDHELLAARYRAFEQALGLLALASRLVGGRRRSGRVVVRTRLVDHEVIAAALHADPGRLAAREAERRALLSLPPASALALLSGEGAPELAGRLVEAGVQVGPSAGRGFLVRAGDRLALAEALAAAGRPAAPVRVEVSPRNV